jgi:hypothetical protein
MHLLHKQVIVEHMEKVPCYTTKSGLKIGSYYHQKPRQLNRDEERIQAILLGIEHDWSPRRTGCFALYSIAVMSFVTFLMTWVRT